MSPESLSQLVAAAGDRLTPTERRIAEVVVADPTLLAFGTVSDLAEAVGTSRPSIVRFAAKLGFEGYPSLQDHMRRDLATQLSRPSIRIRQGPEVQAVRRAIEQSIDSVFAATDDGRLAQLAASITAAERVWVLSGETSRAGAHALVSGLSMVRPGVRMLEERNLGRDLADTYQGDLLVVIDFPRYRSAVVRAARLLAAAGGQILAITDGPLSPLAQVTESWCAVDVPAIGPFDSSLPAVALAELLVMEVAGQQQAGATARIDRTEEMWAATGTFYSDP
ncbi:MAG: MurR/RpiR family transcriptional regulator [Acidimicrobiia bacterium]|nr:MurR/RpiR family transcriptional regulator [Acidimicrobiia bacterium]